MPIAKIVPDSAGENCPGFIGRNHAGKRTCVPAAVDETIGTVLCRGKSAAYRKPRTHREKSGCKTDETPIGGGGPLLRKIAGIVNGIGTRLRTLRIRILDVLRLRPSDRLKRVIIQDHGIRFELSESHDGIADLS